MAGWVRTAKPKAGPQGMKAGPQGIIIAALLCAFASTAQSLGAQVPMSSMPGMANISHDKPIVIDPLGVTMARMASGTAWLPAAAPLPSYEKVAGKWMLGAHGYAFAQYDLQSGPRGNDQFGSLNWGMLMASREIAGGRFQVRTMFSLDALGVGKRDYPLLLQSGESVDGVAIHDRQHPHDFFMELGALYERAITNKTGIEVYAAPSGEPALGPVAFMHRPSAADNPAAPIGYHWQDATHTSFGVVTLGMFGPRWKMEVSAFNGREPDDKRFNFDHIKLDSYSGRLTLNASDNWSASFGLGYIHSPDALEPKVSLNRFTMALLNGRKLGEHGRLATTAIYGANKKLAEPRWSHSFLIESEAILDAHNTFLGRAELVGKTADDLSLNVADANGGSIFGASHNHVAAVTAGYIREVATWRGATLGLGATGTLNFVPSNIAAAYSSRTPVGAFLFARVRPK